MTLPSPKSRRYGVPTGPMGDASVNHSTTSAGSVSAAQAAAGDPLVEAFRVMGSIDSPMGATPSVVIRAGGEIAAGADELAFALIHSRTAVGAGQDDGRGIGLLAFRRRIGD